MKNHIFLGMCGVFLGLALLMAGCPQPANSGSDTPSGAKGDKPLILTGQVSTEIFSISEKTSKYDPLPATTPLASVTSDGSIGMGKIEYGKLNFGAGLPIDTATTFTPFTALFSPYHDAIRSLPAEISDASKLVLSTGSTGHLLKQQVKMSSTEITEEFVTYMYVTGDVTVTGTGKADVAHKITDSATGQLDSTIKTVPELNITLKKGWNAVYTKIVTKTPASGEATSTLSIKISDPALKWVIQ
jgi:hypothetical protein